MRSRRVIARVLGGAVLLGSVIIAPSVVAPVLPLGSSVVHAAAGLGAGGEFHALTPQRIYDSRDSAYAPFGPRAATGEQPTFAIPVLGLGGVPDRPGDVLAVVMNITVTEPTAAGWLNAYGTDAPAGTASIVNFGARQSVSNLSIVRPGTGGTTTIKLFTPTASGTAHVVVDVFGWFSTSANADRGARLVPVSPGRVLDTRYADAPVAQGTTIDVGIRGATLETGTVLPDDPNITGVVLNVTGINDVAGSAGTFLSVVPDPIAPGGRPSTSNVNLAPNQIKANTVIVPVGADGRIRIYNNTGRTHVAVDVAGYLLSGVDVATTSGRVVPLTTPYRVFDTREPQWGAMSLGAQQSEDWSFAEFAGSVTVGGVPVGPQLAVIGNLTAAPGAIPTRGASSYLTAYPSDAPGRPLVSNLNMVAGVDVVPNMAILTYSQQTTVRVFNLAGFSHYLFDASAVVLG
jgi:hypothetical protein